MNVEPTLQECFGRQHILARNHCCRSLLETQSTRVTEEPGQEIDDLHETGAGEADLLEEDHKLLCHQWLCRL